MKKIAVVGSVNIDTTMYVNNFPRVGETINAFDKKIALGGKGLNQAVAIYRSGSPVTFFCSIGKDKEGELVKKLIKEIGLDVHFDELDQDTGAAYILVDKDGHNEIITNKGANGNILPYVVQNEHALDDYDIIVLQNEIPSGVNDFILEKYGDKKTIIFNPAPARKIDSSNFNKITYLIPNETELEVLSDQEKGLDRSINKLLEKGVKNLVVTLGNKGSYYVSGNTKIKVKAYKVKAIDTVAAGDTFIGYFSSALSKDLAIDECLRFANLAAALSVTKKGASSSIPDIKEVEEFSKNI